mgnify:FL=1
MVNIAILGYGVVGSGVAEVIRENATSISQRAGKDVRVKKILDIRDFPQSPDRHLITKNADEIFNDEEIKIVAETIGGATIAYEFTKRALNSKKHVVTSNKELVAKHGPELLKLARQNGVSYLFEASVGGGIPIIRPLNQCLSANVIDSIMGILNGTTNYILTQMKKNGTSFDEALKNAQKNGYAEADPTADIEGHDACRKIAILSSIAYNQFVDYRNIYTEGITKITVEDMEYAEAMDMVIKLVAMSKRRGHKIEARVSPLMLPKNHPLANVDDVFNAILVSGNAIGDAMFYGRGAGKLPTASAVVADIIDIVRHLDKPLCYEWKVVGSNNVLEASKNAASFFARIRCDESAVVNAKNIIFSLFGQVEFIKLNKIGLENEIAFKTTKQEEGIIFDKFEQLKKLTEIVVVNCVRVYDDAM